MKKIRHLHITKLIFHLQKGNPRKEDLGTYPVYFKRIFILYLLNIDTDQRSSYRILFVCLPYLSRFFGGGGEWSKCTIYNPVFQWIWFMRIWKKGAGFTCLQGYIVCKMIVGEGGGWLKRTIYTPAWLNNVNKCFVHFFLLSAEIGNCIPLHPFYCLCA